MSYTSPADSTNAHRPPSRSISAILPGLVDRATTATKGSPMRRAKYASLIAVDPLEASTTVLPRSMSPLQRA